MLRQPLLASGQRRSAAIAGAGCAAIVGHCALAGTGGRERRVWSGGRTGSQTGPAYPVHPQRGERAADSAAEQVVLQGATSRAPQGVTCREQVAEPDKGLREGERSRWSNSCPLPLPPLGPWRREGVGGVGGGGAAIMIAGTAVTALALLSLGCGDGGGAAGAGAQP